MFNLKKKRKKKAKLIDVKSLPFSKQTVTYARLEAYIFSLILIFMVWFEKDVSAIAIVLSLSWAGYRLLQCFYINLAKHEHLMDKKIEYKKLGLETESLDEELIEIESEDINFDELE